ncbi:type VI secretion system tube protein Hcp [Pedobacter frigidisoli]|uniref:Type VI secretion system tube protein Hcp n=1 Tax=Pedobacter frigidisoli TaxID=2530455 RepID=A0A4R0P2P5_9SPHI|nr:type VI secretion system tube protein TssD [Pedobacter frigidisoli]TCD10827.1 type VI secretion system tube protein Hcp [Pedobacter frigidisoli]
MALNAYLSLRGEKLGQIKGSVIQKGRENKIMVIAVSHQISSNPSIIGRSGGGTHHTPFIITKELDKSTPLLFSALASNEVLTEWILQFWAPQNMASSGSGTDMQRYTVKLTNARITNINFIMLNNKNPELVKFTEYEEISFSYEKIEWLWTTGGITAMDDWNVI